MIHADAIVTFHYELNKVNYPTHKTPLHNVVNGLNRGVSVIGLV